MLITNMSITNMSRQVSEGLFGIAVRVRNIDVFDTLFRRSGFTSDKDFMNLIASGTEALLPA